MSITFSEAGKVANKYILEKNSDYELVLCLDKVIEKDFGWIFYYTTKKHLETNDFRYSLGGNAPFIINRENGEIVITGTANPINYYIDQYEKYKQIK